MKKSSNFLVTLNLHILFKRVLIEYCLDKALSIDSFICSRYSLYSVMPKFGSTSLL